MKTGGHIRCSEKQQTQELTFTLMMDTC